MTRGFSYLPCISPPSGNPLPCSRAPYTPSWVSFSKDMVPEQVGEGGNESYPLTWAGSD